VTLGRKVLEFLAHLDGDDTWIATLLVAASSVLEHVFPPFPGDLGVTLGAAVSFARAWPIAPVFAAAVGGSVLGASLTWHFGRWLEAHTRQPREQPLHPRIARIHDEVMRASGPLDRHGFALIAASRFVPAVRAFVVIAAGFRAMPLGRVLAASTLGAALWDAALFTLAAVVGRNLDALAHTLDTYNRVVLAVVGGVACVWLLRAWWRRRASVARVRPPEAP
jgi:membrane protein DedA with SNARE-associated domain